VGPLAERSEECADVAGCQNSACFSLAQPLFERRGDQTVSELACAASELVATVAEPSAIECGQMRVQRVFRERDRVGRDGGLSIGELGEAQMQFPQLCRELLELIVGSLLVTFEFADDAWREIVGCRK